MATREKLIAEKKDLTGRLYYCSNSGEGRKVRREIEKRLYEIDAELGIPISRTT